MDISQILAIDPPGCGCTECMVGEYVPINHQDIDKVFAAVLDGTISPRNNQSGGTLIIYRDTYGRYDYQIQPTMVIRSDYVLIPPYQDNYWADNSDEADEHVRVTEDMVGVVADYASYDDAETALGAEQVKRALDDPTLVVNETRGTVIAYASPYGEYGWDSIPADNPEDIVILWYED